MEKPMQCENTIPHLGAYFTQCQVKLTRCTGEAKWAVRVNPPSKDRSGIVRLCDHCNKFDYLYFKRSPIEPQGAGKCPKNTK